MSTNSSQTTSGESHSAQVSQAQRTAEAKAAFTASLKAVGANIDSELQARAKTIQSMDESLTKQEKDTRKDTQKLSKQNEEVQKFLDKSNKRLAAFDGLNSLHTDLDGDLEDIEEMLNMLEQEDVSRNTN